MTSQPLGEIAEAPTIRSLPSRRVVFGIVAMGLFMGTVDSSIVATALPTIHASLRTSLSWSGWTITIYSLGLVTVLPLAGRFSDQFGRRRVFLFGVLLFTISSLFCGLSNDVYMLIVFRALQAIGGGALQPSAAGIVSDCFGRDRDRALGMFSTISAGGTATGPIFGGLLVGYLSWRWIFFVNLPIGVVLFFMILRFIPESRPHSDTKIDLRGLLLVVSFTLAAIIGITNLGSERIGVSAPAFAIPELAAVGLLVLFILHTRTAIAPFIPMTLLRAKGFAVINLETLLWGVAAFGVGSLVPLYAEERYHLRALNAGALLTARGVCAFAVGIVASLLLRRTGYRVPMAAGFVLVAVGLLVISIAPAWGMSPYVWLSIGAGITGIGFGTANPASRNASMQLAPDQVAVITGLRSMFSYMGVIFGVSIITAILNRSADPGITQAHVFWVIAGTLVLVMAPLVCRVPEHRGKW